MAINTATASTAQAATTAQTQSKSDKAKSSLLGNFDNFLTLFITQLKYQDPLEPMDTSQFTNNLAQLSGVEQAVNTNANLENIASLLSGSAMNQSVSYLDKAVEFSSDKIQLTSSRVTGGFYELSEAADSVDIIISDANGVPVRTIPGKASEGKQLAEWDGTDDVGNPMKEGNYQMQVLARKKGTSEAKKIPTTVLGIVKGVTMDQGTAWLQIGEETVEASAIKSIQSRQ